MANAGFIVYRDPDNPRDIHFKLDSGASVPDELAYLKDEIEKSLTVLKMLFPEKDRRFEEYYVPLLSLAQLGLVGDNPSPATANRALNALKIEIVAREGGRIKNQYMKALGVRAALFALLTATAAIILFLRKEDMLTTLSNFLFLWTGCMAGVWVSFGARKTVLRFEDLHVPEEDRLEPLVRLFFAGVLTVIIGLLFSTKAIVVSLGGISSDQINNSIRISLLLGLVCGFSEQALSLKVSQQATRLLDFDKKP